MRLLTAILMLMAVTAVFAQDCISTTEVVFNADDRAILICPCVHTCPSVAIPVRVCGINLNPSRPPQLVITPGCTSIECLDQCTAATAYLYDQNTWVIDAGLGCWVNQIVGVSGGCLCVCFDRYLAVELVSLTALPGDGEVTLRWSTASEQNSAWFDIARDGATVARIAGAGTTSSAHDYQFVDRNLDYGVTHEYTLYAVDEQGHRENEGRISAAPQTNGAAVSNYALYQNSPNPFNPTTQITFDLVQAGRVTLRVYDLVGRNVATLIDGNLSAGAHSVVFDGERLPSAMYVYRLEAGNFVAQRKMLLIK